MPPELRAILVSSIVALACRSAPSPSADAAPTAATASFAAAMSSVPIEAAAPSVARPTPRQILDAWNDAHRKHDEKALEGLYAPQVDFYGSSLTGHQCAEKKKAAFTKSPDYGQSIRDVSIDGDGGTGATITFTKTSTSGGKSTDYPAILVVVGGLIVGETDQVSQANLAAQRAAAEMWCVDESGPNDHVVAPYRISALQAYQRARKSVYFKALVAAHHGDFLDFGQFWCPTKCTRVTKYPDGGESCGYRMKLENHSELMRRANDTMGFSIWVEWLYVDAVDGTMYWQAGTVEPLPE